MLCNHFKITHLYVSIPVQPGDGINGERKTNPFLAGVGKWVFSLNFDCYRSLLNYACGIYAIRGEVFIDNLISLGVCCFSNETFHKNEVVGD